MATIQAECTYDDGTTSVETFDVELNTSTGYYDIKIPDSIYPTSVEPNTFVWCNDMNGFMDSSNNYSSDINNIAFGYSNIAFENLENGSRMFQYCRYLTGDAFATPNLVNGYRMYYGCRNTTGYVYVSDTLKDGRSMYRVFGRDTAGTTQGKLISYAEKHTPENIDNKACFSLPPTLQYMDDMFYACNITGTPYLPPEPTSGTRSYASMFEMTNLDGNLDTISLPVKTSNMAMMFNGCDQLTGNYQFPVTALSCNAAMMYAHCSKMGSPDVTIDIPAKYSNLTSCFWGCNWQNVSNVILRNHSYTVAHVGQMFYGTVYGPDIHVWLDVENYDPASSTKVNNTIYSVGPWALHGVSEWEDDTWILDEPNNMYYQDDHAHLHVHYGPLP